MMVMLRLLLRWCLICLLVSISNISNISALHHDYNTRSSLRSSSTKLLSSSRRSHPHHHHQYQQSNHSPPPLKVALIGAGLLAAGSHAPVLQQLEQNVRCVAVWSRNFENAASLASQMNGAMPTDSFEEILKSPHIDALILSTPIDVQSDMVLQALQAGKHVLSEKPLAVSMDQAHALMEEYEAAFEDDLVWNVAGDYKYASAVRFSHKAMEEIGKPFLVSLKVRAPFLKSSHYSEAMWRNQPDWYGGMIVEAFVHASSMLQRLFGSPLCVSAHTSSQTPHIPSLDTMTAQVTWDREIQGTVSVTYASTQNEFELEVIGSQGRMVLKRLYEGNPSNGNSAGGSGGSGNGFYRLSVENASDRYHQDIPFGGLDSDILAFSDSIQYGNHVPRFNTPQDALQDLELVDACLESGKLNGARILLPPDMDPIHQKNYGGRNEPPITVDHLSEDMAEEMSPWATTKSNSQQQYQPRGVDRYGHLDDGRTKWHGKERLT
ncbi:unnamed protein product [Cylindrotheca closterium]|uniref:Gfo/Idh/MocA-like oxidoreductase N-terminal domain-containing protein n=1 Tax=Cylindrotheca closterium TaxID=2856 RepID=A0AAD2PX83_9STRA|nr:unnamed protein product [Cylindrotheca closterium]